MPLNDLISLFSRLYAWAVPLEFHLRHAAELKPDHQVAYHRNYQRQLQQRNFHRGAGQLQHHVPPTAGAVSAPAPSGQLVLHVRQ